MAILNPWCMPSLGLKPPQGDDYWRKIYEGLEPLTEDDILHLQKWVALSYQQSTGNQQEINK